MTVHELKTWPGYFERVLDGTKGFDIRRDDRGFAVGDVLELREWDPVTEGYSGRSQVRRVTYCLRGEPFVPAGYVAMSVRRLVPQEEYAPAPLQGRHPFVLEVDVVTATVIVGEIELALRHPDNTGRSSEIAWRVALDLIEALVAG